MLQYQENSKYKYCAFSCHFLEPEKPKSDKYMFNECYCKQMSINPESKMWFYVCKEQNNL